MMKAYLYESATMILCMQRYEVPWQERSDADFREIEKRTTYTEIQKDGEMHGTIRTPMKPLVPKIESQECIMHLVRDTSPVSQSASRKYIPKVPLNQKLDILCLLSTRPPLTVLRLGVSRLIT